MLPEFQDVLDAHDRIKDQAVRTPLLRAYALEKALGANKIYIKAECLQRTGSFKFRGAYNALVSLSEEERSQGVVAVSSGNHAQGIATSAAMLGIKATIIMPKDVPATKLERTKAAGADVIFFDRYSESRDEVCNRVLAERGGVFVPPFDYAPVIAGQGTAALEVVEQLKAEKEKPSHVLICAGGGGLAAGQGLVFEKKFPKAKLFTVEPDGYDDVKRSLETGEVQTADTSKKTICDAIMTEKPGTLNWPIVQRCFHGGLSVSDDDALRAVAYAFSELKIAAEPGGAVALAAALAGKLELRNKTAVIYVSGGNIDSSTLLRAQMMI